MGEDLGFVLIGQVPKVVAVVYAHASPGLAQVARLGDHLPWYQLCQRMNLPPPPGQLSEVLCHHPPPHPPLHPHPHPPSHLSPLHLPPLHLHQLFPINIAV